MLNVDCRCLGFDPAAWPLLQGSRPLKLSWRDVVWAAVTVGKSGITDLLKHRRYSLHEVLFRQHLVYANLRQEKDRLSKTSLYRSLDPSEKGATSYFIGMAMCKVAANHLFVFQGSFIFKN